MKTIIFDLDGVIIDTENTVWDKTWEKFLKNHGHVYDRGKIKHLTMGRTLEEGVQILQKYYVIKGDINVLTQERRNIAKKFFRKNVNFIPGFKDFYYKIAGRYNTAIATSMERIFIKVIDRYLNLTALFDNHIYSIEEIGNIAKPNPDIFLYTAEQLETEPEECVVIEDSPLGVEAAKRAGMKCIALTTSVSKDMLSSADQIVDSFEEIDLDIA